MNDPAREILIIDDNETMLLGMRESLQRDGYRVSAFGDPTRALSMFRDAPVPLVISDLRMEPLDGIEVLRKIKAMQPETEVLMISAYGTVEKAVRAMKLGAADFMTKPFGNEELRLRVGKIFKQIENRHRLRQLQDENRYLSEEIERRYPEMLGHSPAMKKVFELIRRAADQDSAVLIEGESGTGKELVARALHQGGKRADRPFVRVNCGALNDNLLESELFGHEKGAFTGAVKARKGRFELADGGTLFLDEIAEISPGLQVKLLRAVQQKEFERVGGEETLHVDIRIVAATNRRLMREVREGRFREDLYYRLNIIPIHMPPLRERVEDIPLLARSFLDRFNATQKKSFTFSGSALRIMQAYSWPGNIRELENMVERLAVISNTAVIDGDAVSAILTAGPRGRETVLDTMPLDKALAAYEKQRIERMYERCQRNKSKTARMLGIKTSALYYKLEKYNLL